METHSINELQFVLEVPIVPSKALRLWPPDLARLFIIHGPTRSKNATDDRLRFFAHWLKSLLLRESSKLYSFPLNVLLSDRRLAEFMSCLQAGGADAVLIGAPSDWLIECSGEDALLQIMRQESFERAVFWADKETDHARWIAMEAGPNAAMEDGREDTPFLRFCNSVGGFIFYSCTHDNLEVIGNQDFILRKCLPPITTCYARKFGGSGPADPTK